MKSARPPYKRQATSATSTLFQPSPIPWINLNQPPSSPIASHPPPRPRHEPYIRSLLDYYNDYLASPEELCNYINDTGETLFIYSFHQGGGWSPLPAGDVETTMPVETTADQVVEDVTATPVTLISHIRAHTSISVYKTIMPTHVTSYSNSTRPYPTSVSSRTRPSRREYITRTRIPMQRTIFLSAT